MRDLRATPLAGDEPVTQQNFNQSKNAPRKGWILPISRATGGGTLGRAVALYVLGAVTSTGMFACARPNPRFDADGDPADATGSTGRPADTSSEQGATDFGTGGLDSSDDTGFELDGSTATLLVFASEPSNGSFDFDRGGELEQADAHCASIDAARDTPLCGGTIRAFAFVHPLPTDQRISERLGLPSDQPVDAPNGSRIANSVRGFAMGPLLMTLTDAEVVRSTTTAVWTGLNPIEPGNCQGWTSGNDERRGGTGELRGNEGWATATVASCGTEHPILCLCEAASF